jgi:hypothetical protein
MKTYLLSGFHLLMALFCCFTGLSALLEPYQAWFIPGLFLLAMGMCATAIVVGLWLRRRWARLAVLLLLPFIGVAAFFIIAGSFLWPESFSTMVTIVALAVFAIEFLTLFHARSFPAGRKSNRQDLL